MLRLLSLNLELFVGCYQARFCKAGAVVLCLSLSAVQNQNQAGCVCLLYEELHQVAVSLS